MVYFDIYKQFSLPMTLLTKEPVWGVKDSEWKWTKNTFDNLQEKKMFPYQLLIYSVI